jgi:transposase
VIEEGDRSECERILRSRKTAVNVARRAEMLVLACSGLSNRQVALQLGANARVFGRVRKEYGQRGLAVLEDRPRAGRPRSSRDEQGIQRVVETVCQAPAKGLSRWSARTLARHLEIPSATVNRILRENELQPHRLRIFTFSALHETARQRCGTLCRREDGASKRLTAHSQRYRCGLLSRVAEPTNMCGMGRARS